MTIGNKAQRTIGIHARPDERCARSVSRGSGDFVADQALAQTWELPIADGLLLLPSCPEVSPRTGFGEWCILTLSGRLPMFILVLPKRSLCRRGKTCKSRRQHRIEPHCFPRGFRASCTGCCSSLARCGVRLGSADRFLGAREETRPDQPHARKIRRWATTAFFDCHGK